MLREQLKVIKKELGMEKDDKETVIQKFKDAIADKEVPAHVKTVIDAEIKRLEFLEPQSSEFQVTRNYLDWLTVLPYVFCVNTLFIIFSLDGVFKQKTH